MEVSAFMTEQLRTQVVEQRTHDNEQHSELIRLLVEREAKLETQRKEFETKLDEQRLGYENKLETQRKELEAKLEIEQSKTA